MHAKIHAERLHICFHEPTTDMFFQRLIDVTLSPASSTKMCSPTTGNVTLATSVPPMVRKGMDELPSTHEVESPSGVSLVSMVIPPWDRHVTMIRSNKESRQRKQQLTVSLRRDPGSKLGSFNDSRQRTKAWDEKKRFDPGGVYSPAAVAVAPLGRAVAGSLIACVLFSFSGSCFHVCMGLLFFYSKTT